MKKQLINGILYSKYDAEEGPVPEAWTPATLSPNIRNLASTKSVGLLVGQDGSITEDLAFFPFPSLNLKGLIKNIKIPSPEAESDAVDGALTVLFSEGNDSIYYKYLDNLKEEFNKAAEKFIKLEEGKAQKQEIIGELNGFNQSLLQLLNELRDAELSSKTEAFATSTEEVDEGDFYRFKVIICGDPAVGKTSTVLRFTDQAFRRSYIPTIGTNITEKNVNIDGNSVQFVIWDIAGQSKFQTMRKHFYNGAVGQLLLFDLTRSETFDNIPSWFQDIKSTMKKELKGFLLGNKNDLVDKRQVDEAKIKALATKLDLDHIETSALTGENVDEAFFRLGRILIPEKYEILIDAKEVETKVAEVTESDFYKRIAEQAKKIREAKKKASSG